MRELRRNGAETGRNEHSEREQGGPCLALLTLSLSLFLFLSLSPLLSLCLVPTHHRVY